MKNLAVLLSFFIVGAFGKFTWKDCVPSSTTDPYARVNTMTVSPDPVQLPGNMTVSVIGDIFHKFGATAHMNVTMQKILLNRPTKVPCVSNVGSCYYDSPCEFVQVFKQQGRCPQSLEAAGLQCTCPFSPDHLNLPPSNFEVPSLSPAWQWLATGDYDVRVELIQDQKIVGCFEVTMSLAVKNQHMGFLFG